MTIETVLADVGINPADSIIRILNQLSSDMMDSRDPISYANAIIMGLGGDEQFDVSSARIMMKSLVQQAIGNANFDIAEAQANAAEKVEEIKKDMPFLFLSLKGDAPILNEVRGIETATVEAPVVSDEVEGVAVVESVSEDSGGFKRGEKGKKVREIYAECKELGLDFCIEMVMDTLKVNKACANTHIYNVRRELGEIVSSGKRGRKPAVKVEV